MAPPPATLLPPLRLTRLWEKVLLDTVPCWLTAMNMAPPPLSHPQPWLRLLREKVQLVTVRSTPQLEMAPPPPPPPHFVTLREKVLSLTVTRFLLSVYMAPPPEPPSLLPLSLPLYQNVLPDTVSVATGSFS